MVDKVFPLIFYTLGTIYVMVKVIQFYPDIPSYVKGEFNIVQGIPTEFEQVGGYGRGSLPKQKIKIEGVKFILPDTVPNSTSDNWFIVRYLPSFEGCLGLQNPFG